MPDTQLERRPGFPAEFEWRTSGGLAWIETRLDGAIAAFGTRIGGVSDGPYAALNLGILTKDDAQRVARNRELLARALGREPARFVMGLQVHGTELQVHREPRDGSAWVERGTALAESDGQLTDRSELTPLVLTADCFPLVIAAPGAVAVVHCGWRGVAAGIVTKAIEAICALAGTVPGRLASAIGPGIGPCCYEVGPEVEDAFTGRGHTRVLRNGRLDLGRAIGAELERSGLDPQALSAVGLCTSCNPDLFFSHRRDRGVTGRQAGVAWLSS